MLQNSIQYFFSFSSSSNRRSLSQNIVRIIVKVHLTICAVFLVVVLIISSFAMDYIFDKVFALQIASSSPQPPLPSQIELVAINAGNPPPSINHFNLPPGYRIEPVIWNLTLPSSVTF